MTSFQSGSCPSSMYLKRTFSGATRLSAVKSIPTSRTLAGRRIPCLSSYGLPSAFDLLDAHRRREFVDRKMTGIDHLDTISGQEPQFAIGELRDGRTVGVGRKRAEPDAVGRTPNRRFDPDASGRRSTRPVRSVVCAPGRKPCTTTTTRSSSSVVQ